MINKPLLDTNMCLDLLLKRSPHLPQTAEVFQQSEHAEIQAFISAISFDTLAYVMRSSFSIWETTKRLKEMASNTTIGIADSVVINNALNAEWNDIEDAIQYYCAKKNNCDAIITRNAKDFATPALPVFTPFDFMNR